MKYLTRTLQIILILGVAYYIVLSFAAGDWAGITGIAILFVFFGVLNGVPVLAVWFVSDAVARSHKKNTEPPQLLENGMYRIRFKPLLRWFGSLFLVSVAGYPIIVGSLPEIVALFREIAWKIEWWNQAMFQLWFTSLLLFMGLIGVEGFVFRLCYDSESLMATSVVYGSANHHWDDIEAIKTGRFSGGSVLKFRNSGKLFVPRIVKGYGHLIAHAERHLSDA